MEKTTREDVRRGLFKAVGREMRVARVGTVLAHRVEGRIAARCKVLATGVKYRGREYPSLGAAAMAAARRLGQKSDHLSGPIYWGLVKRRKPGRKTVH